MALMALLAHQLVTRRFQTTRQPPRIRSGRTAAGLVSQSKDRERLAVISVAGAAAVCITATVRVAAALHRTPILSASLKASLRGREIPLRGREVSLRSHEVPLRSREVPRWRGEIACRN